MRIRVAEAIILRVRSLGGGDVPSAVTFFASFDRYLPCFYIVGRRFGFTSQRGIIIATPQPVNLDRIPKRIKSDFSTLDDSSIDSSVDFPAGRSWKAGDFQAIEIGKRRVLNNLNQRESIFYWFDLQSVESRIWIESDRNWKASNFE